MSRPRSAATRGWVVGRVAGAPVVVSPGWVVAAVVLTVVFTPTVRVLDPNLGSRAYVVAAVFVLLLLVSVFLHELAHALVARRRGVVVEELAVTLLGGHTRFGHAAPTPATSTLVAAAGPVVNLALGGAAWALSSAMPLGLPRAVVLAAAVANGFVGLFNLVPGLPLDGGRVLEAVVWSVTGDRHRGTVAAGWVGRAVAVGVLAWVLLEPLTRGAVPRMWSVVWGALVGAFLWSGADTAVRAGRAERAVGHVTVQGLMVPAVGVGPGSTVADVARVPTSHEVVLADAAGRPVAWVDRAALVAVPAPARASTPAQAVAVPLVGGAVDVRLTGMEAVRALAAGASSAPVVAVTDGLGGVVGVVPSGDVVRALRVLRPRAGRPARPSA